MQLIIKEIDHILLMKLEIDSDHVNHRRHPNGRVDYYNMQPGDYY